MIVTIQQRQGIGVIANHPQHVPAGIAHQLLISQGTSKQFNRLAHLQQLGVSGHQTAIIPGHQKALNAEPLTHLCAEYPV